MTVQPSYGTGQVSVTSGSAVVQGSGTAWVAALVNGGLLTVDGLAVPIASVQSDVQLTLTLPWPGTSGLRPYSISLGRADAASTTIANQRLAQVAESIAGRGSLTDYYTKTQVDTKFTSYYTRAQVDTSLSGYYTKTQVDSLQRLILLKTFTSAELSGVLSITHTLSSSYSQFYITISTLSASGDFTVLMRCGTPGLPINSGSGEYVTVSYGYSQGTGTIGVRSLPQGYADLFSSGGGGINQTNIRLYDGSIGAVWNFQATVTSVDTTNGLYSIERDGILLVSAPKKVLQFIFSRALLATGEIKIYGVA